MFNALKKFFGIADKEIWTHDRKELLRVTPGTKIIDNGGITAGWPATVWTKLSDDNWRNDNDPTIVNDSYFQMPILVVDVAPVLVSV